MITRPEGLGYHHHQGVRRRAAGTDQQLHAVVEPGRVAAARLENRDATPTGPFPAPDRPSSARALQAAGISPQRVDLAVVGDHAERLGQPPTGKSVGAETLMDDGQGRLHPGIGQVRVVGEKLRGHKHALVADRPARHRGHVEQFGLRTQQLAHQTFGALAGKVKTPLQLLVLQTVAADEHLPHHRLGGAGLVAQAAVVGRDVAPAQHRKLLLPNRRSDGLFALAPLEWVGRQKEHGHPILPPRRQGEAQAIALCLEELVRHLHQDARPVARLFVGPGRAAVHEVYQHLLAVARRLHGRPRPKC